MTREDKDLLLKDLCARLTYGVKCSDNEGNIINVVGIHKDAIIIPYAGITQTIQIDGCKPYLFPLSSMTDDQKYDFYCRFIENECNFDDFKEFYLDNGMWHKLLTSLDDIEAIIDWFHKNHFDWRGLIPKGLAIDCTNSNIY